MEFVKLAAFAICASLLALNFKSIKNEYGVLITISACLLIFYYGISKVTYIVESLRFITEFVSIDNVYFGVILKIIGITYISEFASDISKDCGYGTLGNQIKIFGKLATLALSMPVLLSIVKSISSLLGYNV